MLDLGGHFGLGFKVIEDIHLTETRYGFVKRSWKERLFSRPWKPRKTHKFIQYQVPSEAIYMTNGTIICHPCMYVKVMEALNAKAYKRVLEDSV